MTDADNKGRRLTALLIVYATVLIDILGVSMVMPIIPVIVLNFGKGESFIGILSSAYSVCQFISSLFMGSFSDKFGPRAAFMLCLIGSVVGNAVQGLAPGIVLFIVFRAATGLLGGSPPIAQAYIVQTCTPEERGRYLSYTGAVMATAFVFGPIMGTGLQNLLLEAPFFAASALGLLALVVAFFNLKNPEPPAEEDIEEANPLTASPPAAAAPSSSTPTPAPAAAGIGKGSKGSQGGAAAEVLLGTPEEKLTLAEKIAKRRTLLTILAGYFFNMGSLVAFTAFFIPLASRADSLGWSTAGCAGGDHYRGPEFGCDSKAPTKQGLSFGFIAIISVLSQALLFGSIIKRVSVTRVGMAASLLRCVGLAAVTFAEGEWSLFLSLGAFGFGQFLTTPCLPTLLSAYVKSNYDDGSVGRAMGFGQAAATFSSAVMPLVMGFLGEGVGIRWPFYVAGGMSALCSLSFVALEMQERARARGPTKDDAAEIGMFLGRLLAERGYTRWHEHKDNVRTVLQSAFPDVGFDEDRHVRINAVLETSKRRNESWNYVFNFGAMPGQFVKVGSIFPPLGSGDFGDYA
eukprot:CAMPEP_0182864060 /NCGR_PEP_ID=MMETSP0034_2-20130328/6976_1 /TAXON_ID=156128 /ORGANISM="Nephroselmis pyriformis, Strain CCMP717" /LENGTH=572 /DNA_ID=CAMNT_0024996307 /DNA_START=31 /DNA_END=1746 /DNA_ORIENTATION=+